jgi:F0F1-type ATP synthase membrane subunit c/vacuolar-type H+-ATPase subunit K
MDFGLAFSFVFKDPDWFKKVAIPALCSLIPVIGPFVAVGWAMKAAKNVMDGNVENALPELDFGADLGKGFMVTLIGLIYSLPVGILAGISSGLFSAAPNSEQAMSVIFYILGGCFGLFGLLLGLLILFLCVVGIANYIAKGEFGAAFKFKELFALLKKSFVSWLLVVVGYLLAMGIIAPLGGIACGLGAFLTSAYASVVVMHLVGQAYNASRPEMVEVI